MNKNIKSPLFLKETWELLEEYKGLIIEINNISDVARIKNIKNKIIASGNIKETKRIFNRLKRPWRKCNVGDIVAVRRKNGLYYHYAVYIGRGKVIHYADPDKEMGKNPCIHKADFRYFLSGATSYEILLFSEEGKVPQHIKIDLISGKEEKGRFSKKDRILFGKMFLGQMRINIFSPEETVNRAKIRLGEKNYKLKTNNCEHFAIWCKTGIRESTQVDMVFGVKKL